MRSYCCGGFSAPSTAVGGDRPLIISSHCSGQETEADVKKLEAKLGAATHHQPLTLRHFPTDARPCTLLCALRPPIPQVRFSCKKTVN